MEIENDHGLSGLLADPRLRQVGSGYTFLEGPVWIREAHCLIFSDIPTSTAHRLVPDADGKATSTVYRDRTGGGNGMTRDTDGNILCCEQAARRLVRFPFDDPSRVEVIAESWDGKRLNSPNDVVVHSSGTIYFTDPTYGLGPGGEGKEQRDNGVYRVTTDGAIELMDDRFQQPNGLVFAPDEGLLYIGDSQQLVVRRFTVAADGSLSGGQISVDMRRSGHAGGPDGMTVDTDGRLWSTGPGGIWVIDPDGTRLGRIVMPEQPANITFGGDDLSTLYVTAETGLYAVRTNVRGIAPGSGAVAAGRAD